MYGSSEMNWSEKVVGRSQFLWTLVFKKIKEKVKKKRKEDTKEFGFDIVLEKKKEMKKWKSKLHELGNISS